MGGLWSNNAIVENPKPLSPISDKIDTSISNKPVVTIFETKIKPPGNIEFELSLTEIDYLGVNQNVWVKNTGLKKNIIHGHLWFSCANVIYSFKKGSSRYVPMSLDTELKHNTIIEVKKTSYGNGFFPTVAAQSVDLIFQDKYKFSTDNIVLLKEILSDMNIKTITIDESQMPKVLTITNTDISNSILEFDFFPHDMGFCLAILHY